MARASSGPFSERSLVKAMWEIMTKSCEAQQFATSSLTGERIAKIKGYWREKPLPPPEGGDTEREVVIYADRPLTGEEWDEKFGRP